MIPLHYRLKRNSVNSQTFNELAIYCCNICKRTCVCVCVEMCKISESRKRFQISTNISNEYLLCYSRLAQDRLRSKGSKDLISWNAVRIVRFPLMFFSQFHISMQKVHERAIFPSIFADLLEPHESIVLPFLLETCMCLVCVCVFCYVERRHLKQTTRINE